MTNVNWLITDTAITVNYSGETHIISRSNELAEKLKLALKEKRYDDIPKLVSLSKYIEEFSNGNFLVKDGQVFIDGAVVPKCLSNRIVQFAKEDLPYEPLIRFWNNLKLNPSYRSVQQLYSFLERNNHPICDDGCFIAYKKVRNDFMDAHSGTFNNSVGNVVKVFRNEVDEDPQKTCSAGLHLASWHYASELYNAGQNAVMLEAKVNPRDVVAVPVDYDQGKMRVCEYLVLSVIQEELCTSLRIVDKEKLVVTSSESEDFEDDDLDEDELDEDEDELDEDEDELDEDEEEIEDEDEVEDELGLEDEEEGDSECKDNVRNKRYKLSPKLAENIRQDKLTQPWLKTSSLAQKYGVSTRTIQRILKNEMYPR